MKESAPPCFAEAFESQDATRQLLLVEDDDAIRDLLSEILFDEGYQVAAAANGEEALKWLESSPLLPHLIITDLMMPRMNGWELRHRLCSEEPWATIPVLALSAAAASTMQAWPSGEAPNVSLSKPLNLEHFLAIVERLCDPSPSQERPLPRT